MSIRPLLFGTFCATAISSAVPASAQQSLYKKTESGWFIYKEAKSCVAYADFETGTMLRLSNRVDEHRLYFSAFNENWEHLRPLAGQNVSLFLNFPNLKRGHGTAAVIVENQGRMGFAGADLANNEVLLTLAGSTALNLDVIYAGSVKPVTVDRMRIVGGGEMALLLTECSEELS
jgi:hypothetical protein